jgi:hypothetical protein
MLPNPASQNLQSRGPKPTTGLELVCLDFVRALEDSWPITREADGGMTV